MESGTRRARIAGLAAAAVLVAASLSVAGVAWALTPSAGDIAYTSALDSQLHLAHADGTQVGSFGVYGVTPKWSPDGKRVGYWDSGNELIAIYDVSSGARVYLAARPVVLPKASVTTPAGPSTARRGRTFTVSGYVAPKHSSGRYLATLYCYRYQSGHYVLRKTVMARRYSYSSKKSKYRASVSLPYAGTWRIRAYHADSRHGSSWSSGYRYVKVR
jgi:hypothetical protein